MKKFTIILTVLIAIAFSANAQWQQTALNTQDVNSLAVSGTNMFAGVDYNKIFLTTNNGASWIAMNNGLPAEQTTVYSIAINGQNIFAGTDGGYSGTHGSVFLSTDNGANWSSANTGLSNYTVHSFAISGSNIFAGTDGGMFISNINNTNWAAINTGLPNNNISSLAINGNYIFAGTAYGVFLSTNSGGSWSAANNGLSTPNSQYIQTIATNGNDIFIGTADGVFLSNDNGSNWTAANSGIPDNNNNNNNNPVKAFAFSGNNIFAATWGAGIYFSTNNGSSWSDINTGLTSLGIRTLAIIGDTLFAGASNVWKRSITDLTVGIKERNDNNNIAVFPNPANETVTIEAPQKATIEILNIQGQILKSFVANENHTSIDISGFARGMYFVKIQTKDGAGVWKVVKE